MVTREKTRRDSATYAEDQETGGRPCTQGEDPRV